MIRELQQCEEQDKIELYHFDETGFSQTPCLPYGWSPAGQPARVEKYSCSKRLNVLGFMSRHQKLIEILWKKTKYGWLPVSAYATFEALKASMNSVLSGFGQKYAIEFS